MKNSLARTVSPTAAGRLAKRPASVRRVGAMGVLMALLGVFSTALPASAHGGDPSTEGYIIVQQALGYLAKDMGQGSMNLAMEAVNAALAVKDQEGVNVPEVEQAKAALQAGQGEQAQTLLQHSIAEALSKLGPATGEETGTTLVVPELPGRSGLTGRDWGFLTVSIAIILVGVGLAYRFRPGDSIRELRRRSGASHRTPIESDR